MGDLNGRLDSPMSNRTGDSISPPSLKDGKSEKSDIFRSGSSSPLLDTEPLPLDDQSHCPYCRKNFRKPRVLDCLHSMCEDCIIAQLDGRRDAQKQQEIIMKDPTDFELETPKVRERPTPPGVIRCPICAQESHVGNDVRYVHTMLLDFVRMNEDDDAKNITDRRCRACKSEQSAVAFCKQCQSDLCSNCLTAHGVMRMFDGHEAVTYAELESAGERSRNIRTVLCPVHHQPFKVLCATCETLACKPCLEMEHVNHKVIDVNELVVGAINKEIRGLSDKVEKKWRDSMAEWSSIPDRSATLHEHYDNARARIDIAYEQVLKALDDAKTKKIKELDDARAKQEQAIDDLYRKMNLNEARVNDALCFTRRLLEKSNGMELLASRRKVVQQLNNLQHTMPALGVQAELEFQPASRKQLESQVSSALGMVMARTVSSTKEQPASTPTALTPAAPINESNRSASSTEDWTSRPNGASNLGAIGNERKKTVASRSSSDVFGGWPPSSNPPELPSPMPSLNPKDLGPIPPIGAGAPGSAVIAPPASTISSVIPSAAAAIYNNYQWPPSSNPPQSQPGGANATAALQAQLARHQMALMMNQIPSNPNLMMLQQAQAQAARLRGSLPGMPLDPLMSLSGLGALSLSGNTLDGPGAGQRTSPQEGQIVRSTDLKVHSVFGTSAQGSSIRELHCPSGFCLSDTDDILIADTNNHRVVVCGPPHPWKIGRPGTDDGMLCFPRKVVFIRGEGHTTTNRYVVLDKGADGKTRAQMFDPRGDFLKKINLAPLVPRGGIEVSAATCTPQGHLLLVDTNGGVYCLDVEVPRVVFWFDGSAYIGEASDVAVYDKLVYITDFKHHCVQVFNMDGHFIRKLGEPSQTPYPIGIDITKNGDILVADTHGNHLHVVIFSNDGQLLQSFTHNEFRLSRCVGLRVANSGHLVTLCKHNHTLFVFKPLAIRDAANKFAALG